MKKRNLLLPVLILISMITIGCDQMLEIKEITEFKLLTIDNKGHIEKDYIAKIKDETITLTLPETFNTDKIVPTILFAGKEITPRSKEPVTLVNNSATYTVTAHDNSTKEYQLKIKRFKYSHSEENFIIHYNNPNEPVHEYLKALNKNFKNLCNKYQVQYSNKIEVDILSDYKNFHKIIAPIFNIPAEQIPAFIVGAAIASDKILLTSALNPGPDHTSQSILQTLKEELPKTIIAKLTGLTNYINLSDFFKDGIAVYETGAMFDIAYLDLNNLPSIEELNQNYYEIHNRSQISARIIQFIIEKHGYTKLRKVLLDPLSSYTILNTNPSSFSKELKIFLEAKPQLLKYRDESRNFIFKYQNINDSIKAIPELKIELENNYKKLKTKYNFNYKDKIVVKVFEDINAYHKALIITTGYSYSLEGAVAHTLTANYFMMTTPNSPGTIYNYSDIIKAAVHEFIHCFTFNLAKTDKPHLRPDWLDEGIAIVEADQLFPDSYFFKEILNKTTNLPSLTDLETNFNYITHGYEFSGRVFKYLVKTYSKEQVIKLLKNPENFEIILGIDKQTFTNNWHKDMLSMK